MSKHLMWLVAVLVVLLFVGMASAQHPILDSAADMVVQKYQRSTCEQLWEQRGQPKSAKEQEIVQLLRSDPRLRREFLDRIAAPITNKMFECGLIP